MAAPESSVTVHTQGSVQPSTCAYAYAYARDRVAQLAKFAPRPILFARVALEQLVEARVAAAS